LLAEDDVREPGRSERLSKGHQPVKEGTRFAGNAWRTQGSNHLTPADGVRECLEVRTLEYRGHVAQLERVSQIGLVATEAQHRVGVGDALERWLRDAPGAEL